MKITAVKLQNYEWPMGTPITNGKHTYTKVTLAILQIETDEGVTGVGVSGSQPSGHSILQSALEHFIPQLLDEDPLDIERIWHRLWSPKLVGRRGMTTRAISVIDIALWDIRAKVAGLPLYKLLGGARDRVDAYIAGGYYQKGKGLAELAEEVQRSISTGARAIKMKIGALPIREDVERVRTVRKAIGDDVRLMVDANCAYRPHEAIQLARRIEEFDIYWFEEPTAVDDYDGHRRIAESTIIPIATGENEYTKFGFRDLIAHRAAAILNPDATICGGITETVKIGHLAETFGLSLAPHGPQEVHVHIVAGLQSGLMLEFYRDTVDPLYGRVYRENLSLDDDGTVSPPDTPGVGLDPDYEALAPYRIG